jgi:hypothetical protein
MREKVIWAMEGSPEPVGKPTSPLGRWLAWVSEGAIVATKPGNAGGAKGPHFRCVSQGGKEKVIDDESDNTE